MKPKEYRERLFKNGRANVRPLELFDEKGIGKDMAILWASYKKKGFSDFPEDLTQQEFAELFLDITNDYDLGWIVEDNNSSFSNNYGAIGVILAQANEWEVIPTYESFPWSTNRNILRANVSFLQMMKYDKTVGIVSIYVNDSKSKQFLKKLHKYGVINYTGTIPKAELSGDRHIFYVRGNKKWDSLVK